MSEFRAQLLAVEAKLAKDPGNQELLSLKGDLMDAIELSGEVEEQTAIASDVKEPFDETIASSSTTTTTTTTNSSNTTLLHKKREKNRKKKAKLREQLDIAESVKQSWQSFANQKGLKGVTKKSIFASPSSATGKVGVGTNGIADAPSAVPLTKRKVVVMR